MLQKAEIFSSLICILPLDEDPNLQGRDTDSEELPPEIPGKAWFIYLYPRMFEGIAPQSLAHLKNSWKAFGPI